MKMAKKTTKTATGKKRGRPKIHKRRTPLTRRQIWNMYKKKYEAAKKRAAKSGHPVDPNLEFDTKHQFDITFDSMKETLQEKGQRPSSERVIDQLISKQIYEHGRIEAIARKKFIEERFKQIQEEFRTVNPKAPMPKELEMPTGLTVKKIMQGEYEFTKDMWDEIKNMYHQLKADAKAGGNDKASKYAKELISENIFGSP